MTEFLKSELQVILLILSVVYDLQVSAISWTFV